MLSYSIELYVNVEGSNIYKQAVTFNKDQPSISSHCPNCGYIIDIKWKFCKQCGTGL